jgi:hypothetical protein
MTIYKINTKIPNKVIDFIYIIVIDYDFIYDNMVQKVKDTFEELYENYSLVYSKCISNKH